jgi:hypothetical protein
MNKITYWLPRVLAILFALFIVLFSFDVFSADASISQKAVGFLMHNVPTIAILLLLAFSWKYEKWGGLLFVALGGFFFTVFHTYQLINFLLISFPPMLIGFLFIMNGCSKEKKL